MSENFNKMLSREKIAKSSLKMSLVTTVSRMFGLVRDQIQAALLGTAFIADAFAIGFMLPNLLRRLFAEGNMVASFIPVFTELEKEKGKEESKKFFDEMSAVYAGNPGVIYEICNEPNGNITWQDVKEYAEQVIPVIQKNDPDALILVGTPQWSQKETEAAADPLDLHGNIMITVHFYAATHGQDLLDQMNQAYELGVPVFVSEFGISEASGNGRLDSDMADQWFESMNKDKISRIAWAVSNKDESSAMFKPDTDLTDPDLEDLSEYGKWLHQTYAKDARLKEFQSSKDLKEVDHMDKKTGDDKDNGIESDVFSDEEEVTDESELEVSIHEKKSWEKDDRIYTQYELELKNPTSKTVSDWKETIRFSKSFTIDQSWNAVFTINDNELIIKPVDWNSKIEPNQKMEDIGFILASDSKLNLRLR